MNESFLRGGARLLALVSLSTFALRCGGSSSDHTVPSSSGSAGTAAGSAGAGRDGSGGSSGASAGRGNGGTAGSGATGGAAGGAGGSAGTSATTGGAGGASGSTADAGRGAGGTSGAGGSAGDTSEGGAGGVADECATGDDCGSGECWLGFDGVKRCLPVTDPNEPVDCFTEPDCCTSNADCTEGERGACLRKIDTVLSCGGAVPAGNACHYDTCYDDSDCVAELPSDATVAVCVLRGALGNFTASCYYGGCRTDADCTRESGGRCHFGLAATHDGNCDLREVFFCAYPSDPCHERYGECEPGEVCAPKDDWQGQACVRSPPMYP